MCKSNPAPLEDCKDFDKKWKKSVKFLQTFNHDCLTHRRNIYYSMDAFANNVYIIGKRIHAIVNTTTMRQTVVIESLEKLYTFFPFFIEILAVFQRSWITFTHVQILNFLCLIKNLHVRNNAAYKLLCEIHWGSTFSVIILTPKSEKNVWEFSKKIN